MIIGLINFNNVYKNINYVLDSISYTLSFKNYTYSELLNYFLSLNIFTHDGFKLKSDSNIHTLRFQSFEDKNLFLTLSGFTKFINDNQDINIVLEKSIATFDINISPSAK